MKDYMKVAAIVVIFILASASESMAQGYTWKSTPSPSFAGVAAMTNAANRQMNNGFNQITNSLNQMSYQMKQAELAKQQRKMIEYQNMLLRQQQRQNQYRY